MGIRRPVDDKSPAIAAEQRQQQRQLEKEERSGPASPINEGGHILVLLMRFTDHVDRTLPTKEVLQQKWESEIQDWLKDQSFGKHTPTFHVVDWLDTDNTELHYSGVPGEGFARSIHHVLEQIGTTDPSFDWTLFDADYDGVLDNLIVLHSGFNGENFQNDCYNDRLPEDGIWSHWQSNSNAWNSPASGYQVNRYMVTSALDGACGSTPAMSGVMVLNYIVSLGLEPLYDQGDGVGNGIGKLDVMSYPYGNNNDGAPGALSAYSKKYLGWIEPVDVQENTYITLRPAAAFPDAIVIQKPYAPYEYLILENRQQNVGADMALHGSGIAAYHIDDMQYDQSMASYPGQDDYPYDHYMVAVLPADGEYHLEKGDNMGDQGDFFTVGQELGPGLGDTVFPNTDGYQYGWVWEHGLTISVVDECDAPSGGKNMLLLITFGGDDTPPLGEPTSCGSSAEEEVVDEEPPPPEEVVEEEPPAEEGNGEEVVVEGSGAGNVERPSRPPRTRPPITRPPGRPNPGIGGNRTAAPTDATDGIGGIETDATDVFGAGDLTAVPVDDIDVDLTEAPEETLDPAETMEPTKEAPTDSPTKDSYVDLEDIADLFGDIIDATPPPTASPSASTSRSPVENIFVEQGDGTYTDETDTGGYDLPGGTIEAPPSSYTISTGNLFRLPNGQASVVPAGTLAPNDNIAIMEEFRSSGAATASVEHSSWVVICSALGWVLLSIYAL